MVSCGGLLSGEAISLLKKLPIKRPRSSLEWDEYRRGVALGAYGFGLIRAVVRSVVSWELTELGEVVLAKELDATTPQPNPGAGEDG